MTTRANVRANGAWLRCHGCGEPIYAKAYARNLAVCPMCGWHGRLDARRRIESLIDPGSAKYLDPPGTVDDPLAFHDTRPFTERLAEARARTGLDEAVLGASGTIGGIPVVVAAMDFGFLGGSLGIAAGETIVQAAETALRDGAALVLVTASGGARMQEGPLALMQMAKTTQALAALDEAGLLTITVVSDPTYGGVAASFAAQADVIVAEPGARMGFAGPRVIEQTVGQKIGEDFQTAESLLARGLLDDIQPRHRLPGFLERLLTVWHTAFTRRAEGEPQADVEPPVEPGPPANVGARADRESSAGAGPPVDHGPLGDREPPAPSSGGRIVRNADDLADKDPWETVRLARRLDRPTTLDYAAMMLTGFVELHGDRVAEDCPAVVAGVGLLAGLPVALVGHQKGHDAGELSARRFGMPAPAGYRKAARLMRLAAKLGIPVVTLIDTPGAHPGPEAEAGGQAAVIAAVLRLMCELRVPIVSVVTGEGGSGGALALGVADRVYTMEHGFYSVISPEGCASILWRDAGAAARAAAVLRLRAGDLLRLRVVDGVIREPGGGAHRSPAEAAGAVAAALATALRQLRRIGPCELVASRRARFRSFGLRPEPRTALTAHEER
ncbi:acetyl-CoA carboxylase carboxyl transferase subunit beta [Actinoallomurus purpureus]|uniref:carboxyltransferase subunit alpha n=1 Tax=Actinoallomurus purpureus TaxID=478114 RepID=UPI002092F8F9|nr:carboxyltransferase subunit alpha [Actinoallomurus purpureus]MCO6008407.1 acetyl-CoA carboxylase carboxyl transferase subunit beta [Actinoallomurus purpureus]